MPNERTNAHAEYEHIRNPYSPTLLKRTEFHSLTCQFVERYNIVQGKRERERRRERVWVEGVSEKAGLLSAESFSWDGRKSSLNSSLCCGLSPPLARLLLWCLIFAMSTQLTSFLFYVRRTEKDSSSSSLLVLCCCLYNMHVISCLTLHGSLAGHSSSSFSAADKTLPARRLQLMGSKEEQKQKEWNTL